MDRREPEILFRQANAFISGAGSNYSPTSRLLQDS
jgi:hypothetical protein